MAKNLSKNYPVGQKITYNGKPGVVFSAYGDRHLFDYLIYYVERGAKVRKEVLATEIEAVTNEEFWNK